MGVLARSLVAAACTCVSQLAADSVHSLGSVGGLALESIVALEAELARRACLAVKRLALANVPPDEKPADGSPTLSAGGTACASAGAARRARHARRRVALASRSSRRARANEVAALLVVPELKNLLHALQETSDAFEAGLAVDSSEVQLVADALRNLLPLCTLLQPAAEFDAAASVPASAPQRARQCARQCAASSPRRWM